MNWYLYKVCQWVSDMMGIHIRCVNGYLYQVFQWVLTSGVSMGIYIRCVNKYLYQVCQCVFNYIKCANGYLIISNVPMGIYINLRTLYHSLFCSERQPTCVTNTPVSPATLQGLGWLTLLPSPSCPFPLYPQPNS